MSEKNELLPCPFCGSSVELELATVEFVSALLAASPAAPTVAELTKQRDEARRQRGEWQDIAAKFEAELVELRAARTGAEAVTASEQDYQKHPFRCSASEQDFYSYSVDRGTSSTPPCPACGKPVKLMFKRGRGKEGFPRFIPTHNARQQTRNTGDPMYVIDCSQSPKGGYHAIVRTPTFLADGTELALLAAQPPAAAEAGPIYQWRGNSIDKWTDTTKEIYDNIGFQLAMYPADQPKPTWERRIVYGAQPPAEPVTDWNEWITDASRDEYIEALLDSLDRAEGRETQRYMVRTFMGGWPMFLQVNPKRAQCVAWVDEKAGTLVFGGWDKQPFAKSYRPVGYVDAAPLIDVAGDKLDAERWRAHFELMRPETTEHGLREYLEAVDKKVAAMSAGTAPKGEGNG